jgi:HK97 family phage major capsid protein
MTNEDALRSIKASLEEFKRMFESDQRNFSHLENEFGQLRNKFSEIEARAGGASDEEVKSLRRRMDELEAASKRLPQRFGGGPETLGGQFVGSDAYKRFDPLGGHTSDAVQVSFWTKAGEVTGASLGDVPGYLYQPSRVPGIIAPPELQPRVRDLFPVNPTSVGAVEFVRRTGFVNAAAATAELGAKPQSCIEMEIVSIPVRTIAHWLPATRQIVSDSASLRAFIDTQLLYGLALAEDDELLYGDGSGAHLTGLLTDPDIQTLTQAAGDNKADVIRRAMTLTEIAGYPATGTVLHPQDWEDIELLKDDDGRYLFANPQLAAARRLWGLPVVTSLAMVQGSFATGAFALAAAIWDREQSLVRLSDQHEDYFTRNLVAILAEERLALTNYRPEAIVLGTFTGGGS